MSRGELEVRSGVEGHASENRLDARRLSAGPVKGSQPENRFTWPKRTDLQDRQPVLKPGLRTSSSPQDPRQYGLTRRLDEAFDDLDKALVRLRETFAELRKIGEREEEGDRG